jgi:hypothetical protein
MDGIRRSPQFGSVALTAPVLGLVELAAGVHTRTLQLFTAVRSNGI